MRPEARILREDFPDLPFALVELLIGCIVVERVDLNGARFSARVIRESLIRGAQNVGGDGI